MEPKQKSSSQFIVPLILVAVAIYLSLHLAPAYDSYSEDGFMVVMADFEQRAVNMTKFEISESTPKFLFGGLAIVGFVFMYVHSTKRKFIHGKEYGTATWGTRKDISGLFAKNIADNLIKTARKNAFKSIFKRGTWAKTKKEIAKIREKYNDADMILTATEKTSIYNYQINNNTLIVGGSGSGKTRSYVLPNILQAHSSFVVTDPKGEILEKVGTFLKTKDYTIRVLNLDQLTMSSSYNPFKYIHMERDGYEERVLQLIETIIMNTDGDKSGGGSDPFWEKAEKLFLQALFFFTATGFVTEEKNMNTVMELIRMLDLPEEDDNRDCQLDFFRDFFAERFGEDHIGVLQYDEFRGKASGKTAKSIVISAIARLAPFQIKEVRRIFSDDEMHLEQVGNEKTAIFVIVPPTNKTFNFIAGILFTQLFAELNYCALVENRANGGRLPVPCRFILDEFANTCKVPQFIEILAYARSLGVGITTILQSLEQIKKMYEKDWGVIVDNSNTLLYLGAVTHTDTLEYLSKMLGKGTFEKRNQSHSKGKSGGSSQTIDSFGRELLTVDEIRMMKRDKCLLIVGGTKPFYSRKFDYTNHKNYKFTSDFDRDNSYAYERDRRDDEREHENLEIATSQVGADNVNEEADAGKTLNVAELADQTLIDSMQVYNVKTGVEVTANMIKAAAKDAEAVYFVDDEDEFESMDIDISDVGDVKDEFAEGLAKI